MKTIILVPVKNEAWILRSSLSNFSSFADYIIVADQRSTDGSREICAEFPKVSVIDNPNEGHSNKVRWMLLDEARKIPGNNLIVCIDADEMLSPEAAQKMLSFSEKNSGSGRTIAFQLPWIQLWKSAENHRVDSVWKDNSKTIAFLDDRKIGYEQTITINDHTARVPQTDIVETISEFPLLHLQFMAWEQTQIKQAWYRCSELVAGGKSPQRINYAYEASLDGPHVVLEPTPPEWLTGIPIPVISGMDISRSWQYQQILEWFEKYGAAFFERLEIWHIPRLRDIFMKSAGRVPKPKRYSRMLRLLSRIRRAIRKAFNI